MKIVYCISGLFNSGGMERVLTNKANYLVEQGFDVTIITTDQGGREYYFCLDPRVEVIDLGINYLANNGKGLLYKLCTYPSKQRLHRRRLEEILLGLGADITISLFDHDAGFLWKIKDGSTKMLEIHFSRFKRLQYGKSGIWGLINRYRSRLDRQYAAKYARFIVLTEEDREYWGQLDNIAVIPNANSFQPEEQSVLDQKLVTAVGRFDHQKQFEHLIRAWALLRTDFPDWKLRIFGQGELENYLQDCIDQQRLRDVVTLCQPVQDIEREYMHSSIVAMTSRYEGLPMVLLEAQACGLPAVSYACKCGPRDIIEDGRNGFLVAEGDIPAFAGRLKALMGNEALRYRMGQEARVLSERFTEDRVMQQWIKLFKELDQ